MKTLKFIKTLVALTSVAVGSLAVWAENPQCHVLSVSVSEGLTAYITAYPSDAEVTYSISGLDDKPQQGESGMTIDLKGIYHLDADAWLLASPASPLFHVSIHWVNPYFTDVLNSSDDDDLATEDTGS